MARTDQQRYDQALAYLKTVNQGLGDEVDQILQGRAVEAGKDASLEKLGYWRSGSDAQHMAVRALVLCQKAFLTKPYFKGFFVKFDCDRTKRHYHGKSESVVKDAIKCYLPCAHPSLADLVDAAKKVNETSGDFDFYTLTRAGKNLGSNPICFSAVRLWLFKAGFVSIRWLASDGFDLTANSANRMLGDGRVISLDEIDTIEAGHIFNFHAQQSKPTCHWGLSLGNGKAVAANTTAQFLKSAPVLFTKGNSFYGEFSLRESYEACKWKYALVGDVAAEKTGTPLPEIVIRDIDPQQVRTYF